MIGRLDKGAKFEAIHDVYGVFHYSSNDYLWSIIIF